MKNNNYMINSENVIYSFDEDIMKTRYLSGENPVQDTSDGNIFNKLLTNKCYHCKTCHNLIYKEIESQGKYLLRVGFHTDKNCPKENHLLSLNSSLNSTHDDSNLLQKLFSPFDFGNKRLFGEYDSEDSDSENSISNSFQKEQFNHLLKNISVNLASIFAKEFKYSKIGNGAYGTVYKFYSNDGTAFSIKLSYLTYHNFREIKIIHSLHHENIQCIFAMGQVANSFFCIVMKLYQSTLTNYIYNRKKFTLETLKYLYQILKGMNYLRKEKVMHRDIKPDNICIDTISKKAVIIDFGFAKKYKENKFFKFYSAFTPGFEPPELIIQRVYDISSDMWSFGSVLAFCVLRKYIFFNQNRTKILSYIIKKFGVPTPSELHSFQSSFITMQKWINEMNITPKDIKYKGVVDYFQKHSVRDKDLLDLLSRLYSYCPNNRPTPEDAMNHPFFRKYNAEQPIRKGDEKCSLPIDQEGN